MDTDPRDDKRYGYGAVRPRIHAFVIAYNDTIGNLKWYACIAKDEADALKCFNDYCPGGKAGSIYKKTANIKMNPTVEML